MDVDTSKMDQEIVKRILDALNNKDITYAEAQQISRFFLLNSNNKTDMYAFLGTLSQKWHIFGTLFVQTKTQLKQSTEDTAKLEQIKEQLLQFTKKP